MNPLRLRMSNFLSIAVTVIITVTTIIPGVCAQNSNTDTPGILPSNHTQNVAIILSSSTFYHNYRHTTNALAIYQSLKKHGGYTDDNIILMLADEVACNARNPFKNSIFPSGSSQNAAERRRMVDLYGDDVQVDYSGNDVTVDNFFRVLLGRHGKHTPAYQRLKALDNNFMNNNDGEDGQNTNVFIYLTGHGGDGFFKFRDVEDFQTADLRGVLEQMTLMKRFNNMLILSDTCQAFTLDPDNVDVGGGMMSSNANAGAVKNVYTVASSLKGQNSYAHHGDAAIGHSVIDRYVYYFMEYMGGFGLGRNMGKWGQLEELNLKQAMVNSMPTNRMGANIGWSDKHCDRSLDRVPLSDFLVMRQGSISSKMTAGGDGDDDTGAELLYDTVDFW